MRRLQPAAEVMRRRWCNLTFHGSCGMRKLCLRQKQSKVTILHSFYAPWNLVKFLCYLTQ